MAYRNTVGNYMRSMALARNVVLKGSTMEQYEPIGDQSTAKNATTESKNKIQ